MRIREGMGRLKLALRGAFAVAAATLALGAGAVPALAVDAGDIAAAADVGRFSIAARAANGNNGYNMAGATYGVYDNAGCTGSPVATLVVQDNNGTTNTVELVQGTYYVKELAPDLSKGFTGYRVSSEIHTLTVNAGQTSTVTDATEPMISGTFSLEKGQANTGSTQTMQGNVTSMAGVEYRVEFWTYIYGSVAEARQSGAADCTVTMTTDAQGRITKAAFEDGSAITDGTWAYQDGGRNVVPCGTVVVTEVDTNNDNFSPMTESIGYNVMDYYLDPSTMRNTGYSPETVKYRTLTNGSLTNTGSSILVSDEPAHFGGLKVTKVDNDRDQTMNGDESKPQGDGDLVGITYRVSNESTGPVWVRSDCPGILKSKPSATYDNVQYVRFDAGEDICEVKSTKLSDTRYGFDIPANVLPAGTYRVRETAGNESYASSGWWRKWTFTADGYVQEYTTKMTDQEDMTDGWNADAVIRGGVSVYKDDADLDESYAQGDATLGGAEFTVYNKSTHDVYVDGKWVETNGVVGTLTTDDNGFATSSNEWLPYGTYEITETAPPTGYDLPDDTWTKTFTVRASGQVVALGHGPDDPVWRGGVRVYKIDADRNNNEPQGDASMANAVFSIYNKSDHDVYVGDVRYANDEVVMTITTNDKGIAETDADALPYGTYEVRETVPPTGYTLDPDWSKTFTIHEKGVIAEVEDECANTPIKGRVMSRKNDDVFGGTPSGDASLVGAGFTITNKSAHSVKVGGTWVNPGEDIPTEFFTNADGKWSTPDRYLPVGHYSVRETTAPKGYELNTEWEIEFDITVGAGDGQTVDLTDQAVNDSPIQFGVDVAKVDADGGHIDVGNGQGDGTLEGAQFAIINRSDNVIQFEGGSVAVGERVTRLTSGADGKCPQITLPIGRYEIYETAAPNGYLVNPTHYLLTITSDSSSVTEM